MDRSSAVVWGGEGVKEGKEGEGQGVWTERLGGEVGGEDTGI